MPCQSVTGTFSSSPPLSLPAALRLPLSLSLHLPNDMWVAVSISVHAHPPRVRRCAGSSASPEKQKFILNASRCQPSAVRTKEEKRRRTCRRRASIQNCRCIPVAEMRRGTQRRQSERRRSVASECAASILRLLQTVANACCQPRQCENSKSNEQRL